MPSFQHDPNPGSCGHGLNRTFSRPQRRLDRLREYVDAGNALSDLTQSSTLDLDGTPWLVGQWLSARRQDRKKGGLSQERIDALDALGMAWDPSEEDFQRRLDRLREYVDAGNALSDLKHRSKLDLDGTPWLVGKWLSARRQDRKKGGLSQERIDALDALGMHW